MLARARSMTAVTVSVIALGIGANTAIFSAVHSLLLKPLPFTESNRLVALYEKRPKQGRERNVASAPDFMDWRAQSRSFDSMAAWLGWTFVLRGGEPESIRGAMVSGDFFQVLGVKPALGRTFTSSDEQIQGNLACVISDGLWRRRFNADPTIAGKAVPIGSHIITVLGVMPRDFRYPFRESEIWVPVDMLKFDPQRQSHSLSVIARMKPGVTIDAAQQEMTMIALELEKKYPQNAAHYVNVFGLHDELVREIRDALYILSGAVAFVLLIACANAANLLLARGASRRRELAIRASLGASRWRLVRQLLAESTMLSLGGGAAGVLIAIWGTEALGVAMPRFAPQAVGEVRMDGWVLGFSALLSMLTGLMAGLLPAFGAANTRPVAAMQDLTRSATESRGGLRLRSSLVVAEVAVAVVLVAGAGLLIRSFARLIDVNPGFRQDGLLTAQFGLPGGRYKGPEITQFWKNLLERLRTAPGLAAAGTTSHLPLSGQDSGRNFIIEGRARATFQEQYNAGPRWVSPEYFAVMGIPLQKGRHFEWSDTPDQTRVVMINEAFARKYFPNEDPIGQRISSGGGHLRPIIGVVGDVRHVGLAGAPKPELYFPITQEPFGGVNVVVRAKGDTLAAMSTMRSVIRAAEKDIPLTIRTVDEVISESLSRPRVFLSLTGTFASLALLLAALGLYGVISYSMAQRTREVGIRVALGARPGDVVRMVITRSLALVGIGVVIGVPLALGFTQYLKSFLFGVEPGDVLTFVGVFAVLSAAGLAAAWVPARRAAKVNPVVALRAD
jgi:putative ABC transport system permease protein